jgi:hypothetical protein
MFGTALLIITLRVLSDDGPNSSGAEARPVGRGAPSGVADQALIG